MRLRDDKTNKEIIIRNKNRAQGAQQSKRESLILVEKESPRTDFPFQVDRITIIEIKINVYNLSKS